MRSSPLFIMKPNLKGTARHSEAAPLSNFAPQIDNTAPANFSLKENNSLRYIQELKRALHAPINRSEENVMESLKLLKDIDTLANRGSLGEKGSGRHNFERVPTWDTTSTHAGPVSDKDFKRGSGHVGGLRIVLDGAAITNPVALMKIGQDNKASCVDELPVLDDSFGDSIDFRIFEKLPAAKLRPFHVAENSIFEHKFADVKPLYVNIRGQLDAYADDNRSTFMSVDERSMYYSNIDQNFPKGPHNPFVDSEFREERPSQQYNHSNNNRLQALLERRVSVSDSDNNMSTRVANIKEALSLGIALNRDRDNTHVNTVYQSKRNYAMDEHSPNGQKIALSKFNIESNMYSNFETPVDSRVQSDNLIERNDNFYKFQEALDNYQSNYESIGRTTNWSDLKSLNLCFGKPPTSMHGSGEMRINIIEPEDGTERQNSPPPVYTVGDLSTVVLGPHLPAQGTFTSSCWNRDFGDNSEREMFNTKTMVFDGAQATYQSLSDRQMGYTTDHPFVESMQSCDYTISNNDVSSMQENTLSRRQHSSNNSKTNVVHAEAEKSQKIEDFAYNQESWQSGLSNRLEQIYHQAEEKFADFLGADHLFKKNTGHEYSEYRVPTNLDVIEVDEHEPTFASSNCITDKCSIDNYTLLAAQDRVSPTGVVSDNNTPLKFCKIETQYFSFNPND